VARSRSKVESGERADQRLRAADRRDALIDAATTLVASGDVEAVSIESVAETAGVSRPLVYKHFANRTELLAAVYHRESLLLQRGIARAVNEAQTLEAKLRAYVAGCLRAEADRGATLAALRSAGVRADQAREEQRTRDRTTVRYFADLAMQEFGLAERLARETLSVVLAAITGVLAQWRRRPTAEHAKELEEIYVRMAMGGLEALRG
jgi:AcrR family transcriptional regulator